MQQHVLLALTDAQGPQFKNCITDYIKFFKNSQSAFKGEKRTYVAKDGTVDEPNERKYTKVATTVSEKLKWLEDNHSAYISNLLNQEATNAGSQTRVPLEVNGIDFGELSVLELLRLKNLLESNDLKNMYAEIPVRSDSEIWNLADTTENPEYSGRNIFASPKNAGEKKTTEKITVVLPNPDIDKVAMNPAYKPVTGEITTVKPLGDYTYQKFSGEYDHTKRANILLRIAQLHTAVCAAIKECNTCNVVQSTLTGERLFQFLHQGV